MRVFALTLLGCCVTIASGCSMCSPGYLDDYATVGGKWQRSDPAQGRIGSIFSDSGSTLVDTMSSEGEYHEGEIESEIQPDEFIPGESFESDSGEFYELGDGGGFEGNISDSQEFDAGVIVLGQEW